MNCLELRRAIGAEPTLRRGEVEAHLLSCPACAEYAHRIRLLDRRLLEALSVATPVRHRRSPFLGRNFAPERRWALAASLLIALGAASLVWLAFPRSSLAEDVVAHAHHEPQSWAVGAPDVPPEKLTRILRAAGFEGNPPLGRVSYVRSCWFRGHFVPHLVVQDESGPIMLLLLPAETVGAPVRFAEGGYSGMILPSARGSVAVVAQADARLEAVAARVQHALD